MELSRLSSLLAIIGALNIFYGLYSLTQMNWVNTLIPTVTYLIIIYSSAIVDSKSRELTREREMERIMIQESTLRKEVNAV